jgi:N-acetylneuraminic acid mutarotase
MIFTTAENRHNYRLISIIVLLLVAVSIFLIDLFYENVPKPVSIPENPDMRYINAKWKASTTTAPWGTRDAQTVITYKDKMYLFGGLDGNAVTDPNGTVRYWDAPHMSDIWATSDGTNWIKLTDKAPWGHSRSMSAVVFKDTVYVFDGWNAGLNKYNDKIWYSTDFINWSEIDLHNAWKPREGQVAIVYQDQVWIFGGVNFSDRTTLNDVWVSGDMINWKKVTDNAGWSPRYDHAVAVFDNKIYLTGGLHIGTHKTESEVWVSTDGLNWEKRIPEWPSRHGHISYNFDGKLWVIGGWHNDPQNDTGINDTWFTSDGINWKKVRTDGPWTGREDHMGDLFMGKMWLTGGMDTNEHWNSDVYYLDINNGTQENIK